MNVTFVQREGDHKSQYRVVLGDNDIGVITISEKPDFEPWREFRWVKFEVLQQIADFMKKLAEDTARVTKERKTSEVLVPGYYWMRENPGSEGVYQVIMTSAGAHPNHKPVLRILSSGARVEEFKDATWFGPIYHPFKAK